MHQLDKELELKEMLEDTSLTEKERNKIQNKLALIHLKNERASNRPFNITLAIMILLAMYKFII